MSDCGVKSIAASKPEHRMWNTRLLKIGLTGTLVAALCCFTPVLTVALAAIGLAGLLGWLDFVLLPGLVGFAALTLYALWQRRRST